MWSCTEAKLSLHLTITHSPVEEYRRGCRDRTTYVITRQIVLQTEQREQTDMETRLGEQR